MDGAGVLLLLAGWPVVSVASALILARVIRRRDREGH